jgi:hypothetical protein
VDCLAWPMPSVVGSGWQCLLLDVSDRLFRVGLGLSLGQVRSAFSGWVKFWVNNHGLYLAHGLSWVKNFGPYSLVASIRSDRVF